MNLKNLLIDFNIFGLIILACILFYKKQDVSIIRGPYNVRSFQVIQGNEFDIIYDVGRIRGKLLANTPPEAKIAVTKFFNEITNPKVYLIKQDKDFWYVKIVVLKEGKEVDLTDWLKSQNLIWQNSGLLLAI